MQNEDRTTSKGGVLTITRKYAIHKPTPVESYKANLLVSEFTVEQRHIACVNVYIQPDWKVEDLRDFIDTVCWRIQALFTYDPMIGIIVGGDLNKNGMRELAPRLEAYG